MRKNIVEMINIEKDFSGVKALKGVDFSIGAGEIKALIGENGAGKSTLMNILGGVYQPGAGKILINGKEVSDLSPQKSQELGIGFVHQELNLIQDLTVYENIFLGEEIQNKIGFLDTKTMIRKTGEILHRLQVELDPGAIVRELDASYKQIIEIAKALLKDAKIIIMDEPTTALMQHEVDHLFAFMQKLKKQGVCIIFISHKLKEVTTICDTYTVFRDGKVAGGGKIEDTDEMKIANLMVGKDVSDLSYYEDRQLGHVAMKVNGLCLGNLLQDISFHLSKGEIIGFTGLSGDGRTELFECIFGVNNNYTGSIEVDGNEVTIDNTGKALDCSIGYLPKNRKENAIIKDLSILHNMTMPILQKYQKFGLLVKHKEERCCKTYGHKLNIKINSMHDEITTLSGGNQQKVILAKWLEADSDIIILDNPTQGIDVGAKSEIYKLIIELAKAGKSLILLSSEVQELFNVCDRLYVMYHGRIAGELNRDEMTEQQVMVYATGAGNMYEEAN